VDRWTVLLDERRHRIPLDPLCEYLGGLAWTTKRIGMTSDGSPWRPLVHVLDICQAISCCLEAPREAIHNQVMNVGDNMANYQIKEIARVVSDVFPSCELTFGTSDGDNRSYRVSFDKISERLPGFKCIYDVQSGAEQLRDLFHHIAMTSEVFKFSAFTRLSELKYLIDSGQVDKNLFPRYWSQKERVAQARLSR